LCQGFAVMVMMKFVNTPHFDQIPFCPYAAVLCSYIKSCTYYYYYIARFFFFKFYYIKVFGKKKIPRKK
jgi:hypothetical protein